ncbi:MAG: hypothetical protein AAFV80_04240 [Bacteroidota bacterium]
MSNVSPLPLQERLTLEELRANHPDYFSRQRAGLVLFYLFRPCSDKEFHPVEILLNRFLKHGFLCLLPNSIPAVEQEKERQLKLELARIQ